MLNLIPPLIADSAIDFGTKYLDKLIRPPLIIIKSEEVFRRRPNLFPSIEYTGLFVTRPVREGVTFVFVSYQFFASGNNRYVHEVNDCYFSKSSIRYAISLVLSSAMDIGLAN
jgi:hypothetical protein